MICRERGIVESPVLQVVRIPFGDREVNCEFHPVSLRFEITVHRRYLEAYIHNLSAINSYYSPEKSCTHQNNPINQLPSGTGPRP